MRKTVRAVAMASVAGLLGLTLAVVPSQFSPEQAHAVVAPGLPDPINVLPSVTKAAAKYGSWDLLGTILYRGIVDHATAKAAMATKAGTATVNEAQLVAKAAAKFKGFPATAIKGLTKAAGPVGLTMVAGEVGLMMGTGAANLIGIDTSNDTLCMVGESGWNLAAEIANGADCSAFTTPTPQFIENANLDISARPPGFAEAPSWSVNWGANTQGGRMTITEFVSDYKFGASARGSFTATMTAELTGTCTNNGQAMTLDINAIAKNSSTGATAWGTGVSPFSVSGFPSLGIPECRSKITGTMTFPAAPTLPATSINEALRFTTGHPQKNVQWYPEGHALWNPGVESDPERILECRYKFTNGTTAVGSSAPFRELDEALPDLVCPAIPSGLTLDEISIWEVGGGQTHMLHQEKVTPEFQEVKTQMADCLDGSCILELVHQGVSCMENPDPCADWYEDPQKVGKYTCKFGGHDVPLTQCTTLAPYYKPGARTSGAPYGDPETGKPVPNPAGRAPLGTPLQDPEKQRDCFPTGWGVLNPVEWVYKPVVCAFEWAFVPRPSVMNAGLLRTQAAFNATPPAALMAFIGDSVDDFPQLDGCRGPHIAFAVDFRGFAPWAYLAVDAYPLDVCSGWQAGVATAARVIGAIFMYFAAVRAITRYFGSTFNFAQFGG